MIDLAHTWPIILIGAILLFILLYFGNSGDD